MRTKQELRRILQLYDLDHDEEGGFQGAMVKLVNEAGARGMIPEEIVDRLFLDLPDEDRAALGDMLDRGEDRKAEINERFLICQHCKRPSPFATGKFITVNPLTVANSSSFIRP
jgi:hypothetical protein